MEELARLKLRKKRRQAALQALNEVDDRIMGLASTLHKVEDLASGLKVRRFLVLTTPAPERAALLALCDGAAPLLEDIAARLESIRAEFASLAHSDDRERQELETLLKSHTR